MSEEDMFYCSFVSIHYIICECGDTFPSEEALKLHLEKEHPHKKERKEYKCGICESIFASELACIKHYETQHMKSEVTTEHDYSETDPPEIEDSSGEDYEAPSQQYNVKNGHSKGSVVVCEICGEVYTTSSYHDCDQKVEQTEDKEKVIAPVRRQKKHINIKKVVCEVCGKKYASNAALRYHQRVHTGERPYKCSQCTKSFTMPLFLQIHERTHTGERPYACARADCGKAFSNKAALLRHDRVHTGEKPYQCKQCGKYFTQSNSMKLHVTTVHLKLPAPYKSKSRRNRVKPLRNDAGEADEAVGSVVHGEDHVEICEAEMHLIKPDVDLYQDSEIMYEDDRDVTYEIVYED